MRKLAKREVLELIKERMGLGVPFQHFASRYRGEISKNTLHQLYKAYQLWIKDGDKTVEGSIFPKWLDDAEGDFPKNDFTKHKYIGKFPYGEWIYY